MQVAEPDSVEKSEIIMARQFIFDSGGHRISNAGWRWLSKANWKHIADIKICNIELI